jgi:acyl-CoA reductase-like NAD-dependent aldehyde dehydrogenase
MTDVASDPRWKLFEKPFEFVADGKTHQGEKTVDIISPRDKRVVGSYWVPSLAQVDEALAAARKAYEEVWSKVNGNGRAEYLRKIAEAFDQHKEELEFLDAVDVGKTVNGFRYSDVGVSLDALHYYAGKAMNLEGRSVDVGDPGVWHRSRLEPYGVVLEVLPWNGPIWTGLQNVAAILAAGNVAVVKPASVASASFLHFAKIISEILPAGVITVLPGPGGSIGDALVKHPQVDFISLTGGVESGRQVLHNSADRILRVSLELGGKNPNIVLDDADLDVAVMWSTMGGFSNSGQICVCGSRILVQRGIYDEFKEKLVESAKQLVVGDPLLSSTTTGPVVGESHYESIWRYIDEAKSTLQGKLILGGERYEGDLANGFYIPPTIFECRSFLHHRS